MNFFTSSQMPLESEVKTPVVPKILSKSELRLACAHLTYAVPGLYSPHVLSSAKRKGKGSGKGKGSENLHFPSPMQASRLNSVYNIIQTVTVSAIASSVTVPVVGGINFTFNQLDQSTALAAVFDQYRLAMIEVSFLPHANTTTGNVSYPPMFYTVVDLDDSASPTIASIGDYPGCQATEGIVKHKHTFVPHVAVAAYSGAFTSYANETAPWLDVVSLNVIHYGVKYGFTVSGVVYAYDIIQRMHFQFRNVK